MGSATVKPHPLIYTLVRKNLKEIAWEKKLDGKILRKEKGKCTIKKIDNKIRRK